MADLRSGSVTVTASSLTTITAPVLREAGMKCVGENPDTRLVEVVELPDHRWFIGTQYHPEYSSTVLSPSPLFLDFIKSAIAYKEEKNK